MKKLAFLFALTICVSGVFAQNSKVVSALNYLKSTYNELDKAKEAIDLAVKHDKTIGSAKAWKVHGQVYQAIGESKDEKMKALSDNALDIALESYNKALELDLKARYGKEISGYMSILAIAYFNQGIACFETEEFSKSLASFEKTLATHKVTSPDKVDTTAIFNAGFAAEKAENYEKAVEYYSKCLEINYDKARVYGILANTYKAATDTAQYLETLKKGIEEFPENVAMIFELINYYLNSNQADAALENINKGLEKDPSNHTLFFARGSIYDNKKMFEDAKSSYEKAIELKPDYFDAYYNLGALFYNNSIAIVVEANDIPASEQEKYAAALARANVELSKALPFFHKAYEINDKDKSTIVNLKEIYFKLRNDNEEYMAKYQEWNEKVKNFVE